MNWNPSYLAGLAASERRTLERAAPRGPDLQSLVPLGGFRSGGGGLVRAGTAEILSKAGVGPPYVYSAREVRCVGFGAYEELPGGVQMTASLCNVQEIGQAGAGVLALPVGSVVKFWPAGGGWYECSASFYRGTY